MKGKKTIVLLSAVMMITSVNLWGQGEVEGQSGYEEQYGYEQQQQPRVPITEAQQPTMAVIPAQNTGLPRLAVVEFNTNRNNEKAKADSITVRNLVESQMIGTQKYQIITRDEIDKLLVNQQIQVSSISSSENIRKLQLQNISYIVTGSVDTMGDNYAITLRVLDVSTGQYSHSDNDFMGGSPRDLYNGINGLMTNFIAGMSTGAGGTIGQKPGVQRTYRVGDTGPAGGIIFYDKGSFSDGWQYLEAAPVSAEFRSSDWYAAGRRCSSMNIGGFSGWRLPEPNELRLMYEKLKRIGFGSFSDDFYWSSTDYRSPGHHGVYCINFRDGNIDQKGSQSPYLVRAVRNF
jgi:TolB-like protein